MSIVIGLFLEMAFKGQNKVQVSKEPLNLLSIGPFRGQFYRIQGQFYKVVVLFFCLFVDSGGQLSVSSGMTRTHSDLLYPLRQNVDNKSYMYIF